MGDMKPVQAPQPGHGERRGGSGLAPLGWEGARGGELRGWDVFFTSSLVAPTFSWGSTKTREPRKPLPRQLLVPAGREAPVPAIGTPGWWHGAVRFGDSSRLLWLHHAEPGPGPGCRENRGRHVRVPVRTHSCAARQRRASVAV